MKELRIVTFFPAPSELSSYEPFIQKGDNKHSYALHIIHRPSKRDLNLVSTRTNKCFKQNLSAGYFDTSTKIKVIVFSLKQTCLIKSEYPLFFQKFSSFCYDLGIQVFCVSGEDINLYAQLNEKDALKSASLQKLPINKCWGGYTPPTSVEGRSNWVSSLSANLNVQMSEIIYISNRQEEDDDNFIQKLGLFVNFNSQVLKTKLPHAYIKEEDCGLLALLLFGRDVTNIRNVII